MLLIGILRWLRRTPVRGQSSGAEIKGHYSRQAPCIGHQSSDRLLLLRFPGHPDAAVLLIAICRIPCFCSFRAALAYVSCFCWLALVLSRLLGWLNILWPVRLEKRQARDGSCVPPDAVVPQTSA